MFVVRGAARWRNWSWKRKGAILVLAAFLMVTVMAFVAFSVDVGFLSLTQARLQNAADSAALAAAQELDPNRDAAAVRTAAREAALETVGGNLKDDAQYFNAAQDIEFGKQTYDAATDTYSYHWGDQYFPYNIVRVRAKRDERATLVDGQPGVADQRVPLFFAPVLGIDQASLDASAVASFQPRDIMVVLDFSASMSDDSELSAFSKLGQSAVEANLLDIYQDLGSPAYGTKLTFAPAYAVLSGQPASGTTIPHIDVTFKGKEIYASSTKTITSVKLKFSDGDTQTISGSGNTGTFKGTSSNHGKVITDCWVKSGSNGSDGEHFSFSASSLKTALGLDSVTFPYPSGSWTEFVNHCTSSSGSVNTAGYRFKFGYLLWLNYRIEAYPKASQTPDLWKASIQPVASLKDGVDYFVDFIQENDPEDQMGLAIYSTSTGAFLEHGLSGNLTQIKTTTLHRQAGHYDLYTNIGAGMRTARLEMTANGRPNSYRLMVLMTDGLANRPTDEATGKALVDSEAQLCLDNNIKVMTISLGAGADTTQMQEVADLTGGWHYVVPGGANIGAYAEQLQDTFEKIGNSRPLRLLADPGN